jgi:hypothetical protein
MTSSKAASAPTNTTRPRGCITSRTRRSPNVSTFSVKRCSSSSISPPAALSRTSRRSSSSLTGACPASRAGGIPNGLSSRLPMPLKRSTIGFVAR